MNLYSRSRVNESKECSLVPIIVRSAEEPQIWYNVTKSFSIGSRIIMYYHLVTGANTLNVYPTAAISYKF
ncbi:MAG TPA: hypothetical protein VIS48_13605 [Candidatus Kryptonia bacterium]